jgi:hypothetical protein
MFYTRTGKPCPQCGAVLKGQKQPAVGGPAACPECGTAPAAAPPAAGAFEDLDVLVEQLDLVMRRRN